jgi:hypothetical protein
MGRGTADHRSQQHEQRAQSTRHGNSTVSNRLRHARWGCISVEACRPRSAVRSGHWGRRE